jgi:hypothetical protein
MPRLSAVGIPVLQGGEDVKSSDTEDAYNPDVTVEQFTVGVKLELKL